MKEIEQQKKQHELFKEQMELQKSMFFQMQKQQMETMKMLMEKMHEK